jgi:hypothetical protein
MRQIIVFEETEKISQLVLYKTKYNNLFFSWITKVVIFNKIIFWKGRRNSKQLCYTIPLFLHIHAISSRSRLVRITSVRLHPRSAILLVFVNAYLSNRQSWDVLIFLRFLSVWQPIGKRLAILKGRHRVRSIPQSQDCSISGVSNH